MQLSSALLSATVLLAQTTSGFHLESNLKHSSPDLRGVAINCDGFVGFEENESEEEGNSQVEKKPVDIILAGREIQTGFLFKQVGSESGLWVFKARGDEETPAPADLTAPFELTDDNLFVWVGGREDVKWLLCDFDGDKSWTIYLSMDGQVPTGLECHETELLALSRRQL